MQEISNEAKKIRREYQREWRRNNKDRVRQWNNQHWEKKAIEQKMQSKSGRE